MNTIFKYKKYLLFSCFMWCFLLQNSHAQSIITLDSRNSDMTITTSHNNGTSSGDNTSDEIGILPNLNATSRFLAQSTLGADIETIQTVAGMSFNEWIDQQTALPITNSVEQYTKDLVLMSLDSTFANGLDPNNVYARRWYWHSGWWQYTMTSEDVLRNRIALALSEIFVISEFNQLNEVPLALANYYDMLLSHSFGNFRDLLKDITYHPAMGLYLTHVNNPKSEPTLNRFPDENYAREIMQLFTIGLYELNNDGTYQLDGNGDPIPTYDNDDISELAKVFTGMTYGDTFIFGQDAQSENSYLQPMQMLNYWHEPGTKTLLGTQVIPDRNPVDGAADVDDALDFLFNHPNVGPFFARLMIQRLIKSNPSPAYIDRVASAFNDNGAGVRGDMKAFVKAILLDPEARDCSLIDDPSNGMLREPIVRYTQISRAFNAASQEGTYRNGMDRFYDLTGQRPLGASTVFNFFSPDYQPIGDIQQAGLVSPEFQITNSVTILGYANELHDWIMDEYEVMEYEQLFSDESYSYEKMSNLDFTDELALGTDDQIGTLIERLNLILLAGQMSPETRAIIQNTVMQLPESDAAIRVRMAIYLAMISPDYLIQR